MQDVVDKYFGTDCESAETEKGTWKLAIADGDKVGELFYGGEPVCGIYNRVDKMEIEPYSERTTFPKLLQTAMLEHNPDKPVEIMDFQRTFETPLDKAKWLINDFTVSEFEQEEDFADLHNIGLAFTTLTDDELPIQVTADLIDLKITYEFDGEVFKTEEYSDIEEMIENGLTGLDFDDLIFKTVVLFRKHPEILSLYQEKYPSDLVFESSAEDLGVKKEIAERVGSATNSNAISCTGTSGLSIKTIAECYPEDKRKFPIIVGGAGSRLAGFFDLFKASRPNDDLRQVPLIVLGGRHEKYLNAVGALLAEENNMDFIRYNQAKTAVSSRPGALDKKMK